MFTFDLDIDEFRVDTESQVAGQSPWCGGPCDEAHLLILQKREVHDHRRVLHILLNNLLHFTMSASYL